MTQRLATEVVSDIDQLKDLWAAWDELAVQASRPYCAPGWAIPWWSVARPPGSELRAVAVRDGTELVGLAPFQVNRERLGITRWSLLGDGSASYFEPLASGHARELVATAIATALAHADRSVDVLSLGAVARHSPWPAMLCGAWPGKRPQLSMVRSMRAPYVDFPDGGYESWMASRSGHFRKQMNRARRRFVQRGGQLWRATSYGEVPSAIENFARLHRQRWEHRGGSQALTAPVIELLRHAGGLLAPERFQMWTATVDGVAIGAALFVAAGTELHYWLGGFDEQWSQWSPSLLLIVEVLRHAADAGYRRVSLGPGPAAYKYRFATGEDLLDWVDILPRTRRYPYVRLCQTPYRLYRTASNHTPPRVKQKIWYSVALATGRGPAAQRRVPVSGGKER